MHFLGFNFKLAMRLAMSKVEKLGIYAGRRNERSSGYSLIQCLDGEKQRTGFPRRRIQRALVFIQLPVRLGRHSTSEPVLLRELLTGTGNFGGSHSISFNSPPGND